MAEDSIASSICTQESVFVKDDEPIQETPHSSDDERLGENANENNQGDDESSISTNLSVIDQIKRYKLLQAYALSNILNAQKNADGNDTEDKKEEENVPDESSGNDETTMQSYLNTVLYRQMLTNLITSQSPYMSHIGNLINLQRIVASTQGASSNAQLDNHNEGSEGLSLLSMKRGKKSNPKSKGKSINKSPRGDFNLLDGSAFNSDESDDEDPRSNLLRLKRLWETIPSEVPAAMNNNGIRGREDDGMMPNLDMEHWEPIFSTSGDETNVSQPSLYGSYPQSKPRRKYRKREKVVIDKKDYKYSCNVCGKRFKLEASVPKHMWLHTGQQPFSCNICDKKFTEKSNLTTHMRIHSGEKPYVCNMCGRRFTQQASLVYHTRSHTGEKPYKCTLCDRSFVSSSGLNSHMISHSTYRPFKCNVCDNSFARKSGLELHMMVHTGEKPHECPVCGKLFTQRGSLTSHIKLHTGDRQFHCEVCGKSFIDNCTLKKHMIIHEEGQYQCELCDKSYVHRQSYIEHLKVHNDERNVPCPICDKMFRNRSNLSTHMASHETEPQHECEECGKKFTLRGNLKHHMKRAHSGS